MRHFIRALLGLLLGLAPTLALAQSTVLQGGSWVPGHAPMYSSAGSSVPVVGDSGPAAGGGPGVGLSELLLVARGIGTPPYAGQGTGPLGTNLCDYDAPITNATGYHYLCFSANAQGGGLITYGAGGTASNLPLSIAVNGTTYPFPFVTTGVVGPGTSVVGDVAVWNNTAGSLLKDVPLTTLCASNLFGSANAGCVPLSGGGTTNFLRADGSWASPGAGTGTVTSVVIAGGAGITPTGTCTITTTGTCTVALSTVAASTLFGNATGSSAAPAAFTIGSLTNKAAPTGSDLVVIQDQAASGALKNVTVAALNTALPAGAILDYAGASPPTGFLFADGSCVSQVTFANLFAILGTAWGSCGGGLFALPDLRGRITAMADGGAGRITTGGSSCNAVLATGCGAQNRTISAPNVPQLAVTINDPGHVHTITDPGHVHAQNLPLDAAGNPPGSGDIQGSSTSTGTFSADTGSSVTGISIVSHTTGITATANTASANTALPTIPPILITNKIIKT